MRLDCMRAHMCKNLLNYPAFWACLDEAKDFYDRYRGDGCEANPVNCNCDPIEYCWALPEDPADF